MSKYFKKTVLVEDSDQVAEQDLVGDDDPVGDTALVEDRDPVEDVKHVVDAFHVACVHVALESLVGVGHVRSIGVTINCCIIQQDLAVCFFR